MIELILVVIRKMLLSFIGSYPIHFCPKTAHSRLTSHDFFQDTPFLSHKKQFEIFDSGRAAFGNSCQITAPDLITIYNDLQLTTHGFHLVALDKVVAVARDLVKDLKEKEYMS